jgi:hypothetical protein
LCGAGSAGREVEQVVGDVSDFELGRESLARQVGEFLRQRAANARRFAGEDGPDRRAYWEGRLDLAVQLLKELGFDE